MTVAELIIALKRFSQDTPVRVAVMGGDDTALSSKEEEIFPLELNGDVILYAPLLDGKITIEFADPTQGS